MPNVTLDKLKAAGLYSEDEGKVRPIIKHLKPVSWGMGRECHRITGCCGVFWKGKPTYLQLWGYSKKKIKGKWDEEKVFTVGTAGKTVKPKLGDGRLYLRFPIDKGDFLITWRDE